tara:strand:- start:260 stop:361 length:102 start_codon:yes stop_codon:yes gene_type:complete
MLNPINRKEIKKYLHTILIGLAIDKNLLGLANL